MWIFLALLAAMLWALAYVINEQIYKQVSVITTLGITTLFFSLSMLFMAYLSGYLSKELMLMLNSKRLFWLVSTEILVLIFAEILTGFSIVNKNAVLTSLVGISYPIFIVIFTWLLFKENQLNPSTIFGGILVFLGISIIYFFNR